MKIAIDARLYDETGVGRYIRNLINNLAILDTNHEYVLLAKKDAVIPHLPDRWKIRRTAVSWHSIKEQLILPSIIAQEKVDLVHFPYFAVPLFCPSPFVVTIHDLIIDHFATGRASTRMLPLYMAKRLGYRTVMNHTVNHAKALIVPTNATKHELMEHYFVRENNIHVIPEGAFDRHLIPLAPNAADLVKAGYFLYVGNAYPHKNLERLIEGFELFKRNKPRLTKGIKLVLVGKEDYFYRRLKRKAEKSSVVHDIIFLHTVADNELVWLYRHAKALLLPSFMEGFGLPAIEAMQQGCTVAVSDTEALKEVCGDAAWYFDPDSSLAIADIFATILNPSSRMLLEQKKTRGMTRSKIYDWQMMVRKTLSIYERCIGI